MIVSGCTAALVGIIALPALVNATPNDFLCFYYAAQAVAQRENPYEAPVLSRLASAGGTPNSVYPYLYSPFTAQVLIPFTKVPLNVLHPLWLRVLVACGAAIGWFACTAQRRWSSSGTAPPLIAASLCVLTLAVEDNIAMGQVNLLVHAFLVLALISYLSGRRKLAGALLAPAVLIKGTPLVFLGFFAARRALGSLLGFVLCTAVLIGLGAWIGGLWPWLSYIEHWPHFGYGKDIPNLFSADIIYNFSPSGQLARMLAGDRGLVAKLAAFATVLTLLGAIFVAASARGEREVLLALGPFAPVMILASPLAYLHHVIFLAPSAVLWLTWALAGRRTGAFCGVLFLLVITGMDWPSHYDELGRTFVGNTLRAVNLYGVVALYAFGIWAALADRRKAARSGNALFRALVRAIGGRGCASDAEDARPRSCPGCPAKRSAALRAFAPRGQSLVQRGPRGHDMCRFWMEVECCGAAAADPQRDRVGHLAREHTDAAARFAAIGGLGHGEADYVRSKLVRRLDNFRWRRRSTE